MKTYTEQYNSLFGQIEDKLYQLIEWKGEESDYINENCLKLDIEDTDYAEIAFLNGRLQLIDDDGLSYNLSCITFDELCEIADNLSIFNPYTADAKEYPVRHLTDRTIDIDEYPNFNKTGNVYGMKKLHYGKGALLVRYGNYIYNVTCSPEIYFEHSEEL